MGRQPSRAVILAAALAVGGCSFVADDIWPSLTGEEPAAAAPQQVTVSPAPVEQQSSPTVATVAQPAPAPVVEPAPAVSVTASPTSPSPIGATGTFVGAKVAQHAQELEQLKASIGNGNARFQQLRSVTEQNAQRYYAIVAAISARLQIGTTP
ncbi:MAG: hypothetical protein ACE5H8_11815, partial [Alphaproteobacteria bacterium]